MPLDPPSTLGREFLRKCADNAGERQVLLRGPDGYQRRLSMGAAFAPIKAFNEVFFAIGRSGAASEAGRCLGGMGAPGL